jgi:hypothetical protein
MIKGSGEYEKSQKLPNSLNYDSTISDLAVLVRCRVVRYGMGPQLENTVVVEVDMVSSSSLEH